MDLCLTNDNEKSEKEIIAHASKELILLQETGNYIIVRCRKEIKQFLRNGGHLSIIVCSGELNTQSLLAFRNNDLHLSADITHRLDGFYDQIRTLPRHSIDVRYCPYPIDITSVICPDDGLRSAVVRFAGFKVSYQDKLSFTATAEYTPALYRHYIDQIQKYRHSSYKKILITGKPHEGKTTLIKHLIQSTSITPSMPIYYMYTEEIIEDGKRTGFNVISSTKPVKRLLAERNEANRDIPYDVHEDVLDDLAHEIRSSLNKVLVIDEIGIMQMKSKAFEDAIKEVFDNPYCVLIGTVTEDSRKCPALEAVKNDLMSELIVYSQNQHDSILKELTKELNAALDMYEIKGGF